MCKQHQIIISKNVNGQLSYCKYCKVFDLTFNNILIELTPRELISFQNVIKNIDVDYWESHFNKKYVKRNIPIMTRQQNLILIFSLAEPYSLKELVLNDNEERNELISISKIDYDLSVN